MPIRWKSCLSALALTLAGFALWADGNQTGYVMVQIRTMEENALEGVHIRLQSQATG